LESFLTLTHEYDNYHHNKGYLKGGGAKIKPEHLFSKTPKYHGHKPTLDFAFVADSRHERPHDHVLTTIRLFGSVRDADSNGKGRIYAEIWVRKAPCPAAALAAIMR